MTAPERPPVLRGVVKGGTVRFRYEFPDGTVGAVSGRAESILTRAGAVSGLRVVLDAALPADVARQPAIAGALAKDPPAADFALAGIRPDPDTGLVIPVSRRELAAGTGPGAYVRASRARAELAGNGDGVPGFPAVHCEAGFAAMTRAEIDAWIDAAAAAMETQAATAEAARRDGGATAAFTNGDQVVSIWFDGTGTVEGAEDEDSLVRVRTPGGITREPPEQLRHGTTPLVMATVSGPRIVVSARRDGEVANIAVVKASTIRQVPLACPWLDRPVADAALAVAGWHRAEDWTRCDTDMWCAAVAPASVQGSGEEG